MAHEWLAQDEENQTTGHTDRKESFFAPICGRLHLRGKWTTRFGKSSGGEKGKEFQLIVFFKCRIPSSEQRQIYDH